MRDGVKVLQPDGIVHTACELCPWGCGMEVHIAGGKIEKVRGDKGHPLNEGALCPKGGAALDVAFSPERITYPMKRAKSGWKRISWDDALDIITDKLTDIKVRFGPQAFAVAIGMPILLGGNTTVSFLRRFCDIYGTPNCFSVESLCYRCRIIAYILTLGKFPVADVAHARCIVVWGNNPQHSNFPLARRIIKSLDNGAKLICIDPRRTEMAKRADLFLQVRPGSDCALALSMMNVIIEEELFDHEFVKERTVGFDGLRSVAADYPPEKAEEITWVPAEQIREAARLFATVQPACIVQGTNALDQHTVGIQNSRAVAILQALTGNIDNRGGFVTASRVHINPIRLPERMKGTPIGVDQSPLFYEVWGRSFGEGQAIVFLNALLTGEPYPVKALFVAASNPLLTWPNSQKVKEAFGHLDFIAVMDLFMTATAEMANLFLPAATFLERTELCDYYGTLHAVPFISLRKKIMEVGEAWSDLRFWFTLAHRMGYDALFPWKDEEDAIRYALEPTGLSLEDLSEHSAGVPFGELRIDQYKQKGFATPSGKVELYSQTLKEMGYDPVPIHREPLESPLEGDLAKEYPLILTTGGRDVNFLHSEFRQIERLRKKRPHPTVQMHSSNAREIGVEDGDMVTVETRIGSIQIRAEVTEDILPRVVHIPHGWKEANVNLLTDSRPADPVTGFPGFKAMLCRIRAWG
ncbi:MAG: molybdopterin oxidoreductase [Deltaproteobacteria bacterium RBG_13_52_11]|nr:MAG: molybdopterin oxidoreductase [Deltaproteobacteria bacterium RBG_13_52_11]